LCSNNAGALCSLSSLTRLRELRLGDVDGNNPEDVDTICNMVSRLTSLHMGYCPRLQVRGLCACAKCARQQGHFSQAPRACLPEWSPAGITCCQPQCSWPQATRPPASHHLLCPDSCPPCSAAPSAAPLPPAALSCAETPRRAGAARPQGNSRHHQQGGTCGSVLRWQRCVLCPA
jgi:hypothetical protein